MINRYALVATILILAAGTVVLVGCGDRNGLEMTSNPQAVADAAAKVLRDAATGSDSAARAQALESLAHTMPTSAGPILAAALDDEVVAVRFVAAMGVGDVRYGPAIDKLRAMAEDEYLDGNVLVGVIYALYRLGDTSRVSQLGWLLEDREPEVRANAALVLGRMGHPSAIKPLQSRANIEKHAGVRLQLTESLAVLGNEKSIGLLKAYVRVGQPHERVTAVEALGRTRLLTAKGTLLWAIDGQQPPPLRLAAARALARLGDDRGYKLAVEAVKKPEKFTQRSYEERVTVSEAQQKQMQSLGALAIGDMNKPAAVDLLVDLLRNPDQTVAVSAARSILVLLKSVAEPAAAAPVVAPQPAEAVTAEAAPLPDPMAGALLRTAGPKQ